MRSLGLRISLVAILLTSCASARILPVLTFDFFIQAASDDPWNQKIQNWQSRHHLDPASRGEAVGDISSLGEAYLEFERDMRRRVAADTVTWVQERSKDHYRPDGRRDHWATLGEVMESGGDDCDGLDLMTFVLLRRLGFKDTEIFRAILVEDGTAQHHMVTLWFESGEAEDPFILDPTGVVTPIMVRLSDIPTWEPIELFDEASHFAVRPSTRLPEVASE